MIAGYTCDHTFYLPILDALVKHFKVLIFDNRGVGRTTDDGSALSAEIMADEIMGLSEKLRLHKPHVLGQSMGGTIAQAIASRHADKINQLVLITTTAKWRMAMLSAFDSLLSMRKLNLDFELQFQLALSWLFGEKFLSDSKKVSVFKNFLLTNKYPQSLADQKRQFAVLKNFDGREVLKDITAETLIIYGSEDIVALPSESKFLWDQIKNSRLAELPCGHVMVTEVPRELSDILVNFLK